MNWRSGKIFMPVPFRRKAMQALCVVVCVLALSACRNEKVGAPAKTGKLRVVTSLFPLYDFAGIIAGNRAEVTLLMPPGVEPHSFEPKPDDIVRISKAALFVYTNPAMEPWAAKIIQSIDQSGLKVVEGGKGARYQSVAGVDGHGDHDHLHAGGMDPHIWLDFVNDQLIVDNILAGFVAVDPANSDYYLANASTLKKQLMELDKRYREGLASCSSRDLLHGGHYTFGYLAQRYGLRYRALSGVSTESEPSAARMSAMIRSIKQAGVHYLFAEELLSPRLTETLAAEAGVQVIKLHGAHNLSRDDFQGGVTFIKLMDTNLSNLQKGLECRAK